MPARRSSAAATTRRASWSGVRGDARATCRPAAARRRRGERQDRGLRRGHRCRARAGRDALVLVPEASLALPLVDRLRHDLGIEPALVHGGAVRRRACRRMATTPRRDRATVVVGTRLAILAPLRDPGLIVVDEEHDPAYKSDRTPRYQARDLCPGARPAGRRAGHPGQRDARHRERRPCAARAARRGCAWSTAAAGSRRSVEVVDLRAELAEGNRGLLSAAAGRGPVGARHRRRRAGHPGHQPPGLGVRRPVPRLRLCPVCPECQRPLVFHAARMALRCHHCGATAPPARRCPSCASPRIRYLGGGTQRVEQEVGARFPELRVARLDRDVAERRGAAAASSTTWSPVAPTSWWAPAS